MNYSRKETDFSGNIYYYNDYGSLHRTDGPAIENYNGDKAWYINGKRHRENGPAIEYSNGDKHWFINGEHHRVKGPAIIEYVSHTYYKHGLIHRLNAPAFSNMYYNEYLAYNIFIKRVYL